MTDNKQPAETKGLVCSKSKGPLKQETCHPETYQGYKTGSIPIIEWAATFMVLFLIVVFVRAFSTKETKR